MAFQGRVAVAVSVGALAAGLIGGPAFAHVEVEADKTQAGAENVTLRFTGEAESGQRRHRVRAGGAAGRHRARRRHTG